MYAELDLGAKIVDGKKIGIPRVYGVRPLLVSLLHFADEYSPRVRS